LLTGIAVNALAGAGLVLINFADDIQRREQIVFWQLGSLNGSRWNEVLVVAVDTVVGALTHVFRPCEYLHHRPDHADGNLPAGRAGSIVIGCSPTLSVPLMPTILREFSQGGSTLGWPLREADPVSVFESVLGGECAVGLVATAASDDIQTLSKPYLVVDRIGEIPLVLAVPPDMRWPAARMALKDVHEWQFAVPLRSLRSGLRVDLATAFLHAGLAPPLTMDVPSLRAAIPPVSAGALLSLVPQNFQNLFHPDLITFRPSKTSLEILRFH